MAVRLGYLPYPFDPMQIRTTAGWSNRSIWERDVEAALVRGLGTIPRREVMRQVRCCGRIPDVVVLSGSVITIVEIKRWMIGRRAVDQIVDYVEHIAGHLVSDQRTWVLYGVLAAPAIRPSIRSSLPDWCAFQPLDVQHVSRRAA